MSKPKRITGTREWATHTANLDLGCEHDCLYCYAKTAAVRYKRATVDSWKTPVMRKVFPVVSKTPGTLMFPSSHDITDLNVDRCIAFLTRVLETEKNVLIVSKPRQGVVAKLIKALEPYKSKVLFRFTIGSPRADVLKFWEPGAPTFTDRLSSLRLAHDQGWKTSVSCEPMLDIPEQMEDLICMVAPYVTDAVWLGLMNKNKARLALNGHREAIPESQRILGAWSPNVVKAFYEKHKNSPIIKWKDSIKAIVGIASNAEAGLDQ
jgi:DNA repair photolyase